MAGSEVEDALKSSFAAPKDFDATAYAFFGAPDEGGGLDEGLVGELGGLEEDETLETHNFELDEVEITQDEDEEEECFETAFTARMQLRQRASSGDGALPDFQRSQELLGEYTGAREQAMMGWAAAEDRLRGNPPNVQQQAHLPPPIVRNRWSSPHKACFSQAGGAAGGMMTLQELESQLAGSSLEQATSVSAPQSQHFFMQMAQGERMGPPGVQPGSSGFEESHQPPSKTGPVSLMHMMQPRAGQPLQSAPLPPPSHLLQQLPAAYGPNSYPPLSTDPMQQYPLPAGVHGGGPVMAQGGSGAYEPHGLGGLPPDRHLQLQQPPTAPPPPASAPHAASSVKGTLPYDRLADQSQFNALSYGFFSGTNAASDQVDHELSPMKTVKSAKHPMPPAPTAPPTPSAGLLGMPSPMMVERAKEAQRGLGGVDSMRGPPEMWGGERPPLPALGERPRPPPPSNQMGSVKVHVGKGGGGSLSRGPGPHHPRRNTSSKYMSGESISSILRIQYMATHPPDTPPYVHDYYHQAWLVKRKGNTDDAIAKQRFYPASLRDVMPQERTGHTDITYVQLEGLGRVPFSNIRRPKPLLDLGSLPLGGSDGAGPKGAGGSVPSEEAQHRRDKPLEKEPMLAVRVMIEDAMCLLLDVEDIDRLLASKQLLENPLALTQRRQLLLEGLAASLQLPDCPQATVVEDGATSDGVFRMITMLPKGCTMLAQLLPLLRQSSASSRSLLWALLRNLHSMFSHSDAKPGAPQGKVAKACIAALQQVDAAVLCGGAVALAATCSKARASGDVTIVGPGSVMFQELVLLECALLKAAQAAGLCESSGRPSSPEQQRLQATWREPFSTLFPFLAEQIATEMKKQDAKIKAVGGNGMPGQTHIIELLQALLYHATPQQRSLMQQLLA